MIEAKEGDELTVPPVEVKPILFEVSDSMEYKITYNGETVDVICNKDTKTDADIACMFRIFSIVSNLENLSKNQVHKKRFKREEKTKITATRFILDKMLKEMVGAEIRKRLEVKPSVTDIVPEETT